MKTKAIFAHEGRVRVGTLIGGNRDKQPSSLVADGREYKFAVVIESDGRRLCVYVSDKLADEWRVKAETDVTVGYGVYLSETKAKVVDSNGDAAFITNDVDMAHVVAIILNAVKPSSEQFLGRVVEAICKSIAWLEGMEEQE